MTATYERLRTEEIESPSGLDETFMVDVLVGLSKRPKRLPSKYFYDSRGSRLFRKIMDLPEYYLTKCEFDILRAKRGEIAGLIKDRPFNLVELGSGDGRKTRLLLESFLKTGLDFRYFPVDISESAMRRLTQSLNIDLPELEAHGVVAEYFTGLRWVGRMNSRPNLVLFLGSNMGNFDKAHARAFLHNLWSALNKGDLVLIGFDMKKDIDVMLKAYNDAQGITRAFNLNLLKRINRELGGEFDLKKFRFYSSYDVYSGAIESYLVSLVTQTVFIGKIGQSFEFEAWEPIHTEYSYKYLDSDIRRLAAETGFTIVAQLYDSRKYFVDSVWKVKKMGRSRV